MKAFAASYFASIIVRQAINGVSCLLSDASVQFLDFFFEGFSVIPALVRGVKALGCFVDCTVKAFSEGSTLHRFDLRDSVNAEHNQDEE